MCPFFSNFFNIFVFSFLDQAMHRILGKPSHSLGAVVATANPIADTANPIADTVFLIADTVFPIQATAFPATVIATGILDMVDTSNQK